MADDRPAPAGPDWRALLALLWAGGFALLYARMVVVEKLPGLARWLGW